MSEASLPPVIDLAARAADLEATWSPRIVAALNGQFVKVARLEGEFVWHDHAREDELFLVLKGSLVIQFEEGEVRLREGECCVVPRGRRHNPVAAEECWVALFEPAATAHTGDVVTERTRSIDEQRERASQYETLSASRLSPGAPKASSSPRGPTRETSSRRSARSCCQTR